MFIFYLLFAIILILIIFCLLFVGIGIYCKIYNEYLEPEIKKRRIQSLEKYVRDSLSLPDEERILIDEGELRKKQLELQKLVPEVPERALTMQDLEFTKEVRNHINEMISTEVYKKLQEPITTGKKYEIIRVAEDAKSISEIVLNGLDKSLFKSKMIMTPDHLIRYIVSHSFSLLVRTATEYNNNL